MYLSKGYKGLYDLYFINPFTGKRTKISTHKSTLKEAKKFRDEFQIDTYSKIAKAKIINLEDLRVEVLVYAKNNMAEKTYDLYRRSLTNLINIIGNRQLSLVGMRDIENFKNVRVQTIRKSSANMEFRTLKAIFNYAVKCGIIKTNPAVNVKQFKLPEKEKLAFTSEHIKSLLDITSDPIIKRITKFGLYTGCRLNEILNIQISDINVTEKFIIIRNKADFKTKTGKIRLIPITEGLESLLEPFLAHPGHYYFFSFDGPTRLNKDFVSQKFKKYLRKAELPEKYHFHCLRHTFITNLIKSGVPINFVKELAGHSDIQTTMGYVHIELEDLREAMTTIKIAI